MKPQREPAYSSLPAQAPHFRPKRLTSSPSFRVLSLWQRLHQQCLELPGLMRLPRCTKPPRPNPAFLLPSEELSHRPVVCFSRVELCPFRTQNGEPVSCSGEAGVSLEKCPGKAPSLNWKKSPHPTAFPSLAETQTGSGDSSGVGRKPKDLLACHYPGQERLQAVSKAP
ncbi:unnamed protein product [Rangifer tarandus platyrhynchus]|uniref:Uncharacterized protein n=2 Tax=Rangifer tarandus platyrhynchus TaxID=3082113 RepID=A0ACB0FMG1_RANTA|nr:unnamed protein product [Rangifer tarandus platyrhynchus]CAI9714272.1 unnamed protein product [Rangifer tarandus platyrhynchus]